MSAILAILGAAALVGLIAIVAGFLYAVWLDRRETRADQPDPFAEPWGDA